MAKDFFMKRQESMKGNSVSKIRGYITSRNIKHFHTNLQLKYFAPIPYVKGGFFAYVSTKTIRTIEKYGGLQNFLLKIKKGKLTETAIKLRKKLLNINNS